MYDLHLHSVHTEGMCETLTIVFFFFSRRNSMKSILSTPNRLCSLVILTSNVKNLSTKHKFSKYFLLVHYSSRIYPIITSLDLINELICTDGRYIVYAGGRSMKNPHY